MDLTNEEVQVNQVEVYNNSQVPTRVRYSGFWMRFWAYLIDLLVIGSLYRILIYPAFRALDISLSKSEIFSAASITTSIVFYLYFILMTKYFQQTLGKMVFGLRVVSVNNKPLTWLTVIFREGIGRYISKLLFIGYIIIAFLPKKQGIHDLFADTTVIHEE
ncbi:RDD family protein [Fredinandcohnia humi]